MCFVKRRRFPPHPNGTSTAAVVAGARDFRYGDPALLVFGSWWSNRRRLLVQFRTFFGPLLGMASKRGRDDRDDLFFSSRSQNRTHVVVVLVVDYSPTLGVVSAMASFQNSPPRFQRTTAHESDYFTVFSFSKGEKQRRIKRR